MTGQVLISTHDLNIAGRLRDAFVSTGHTVELVTPSEEFAGFEEAELFVVTGGWDRTETRRMIEEVRAGRGLTVFGVDVPNGEGTARDFGLSEWFPGSPDPDDVVLLGQRVMQRRHLREVTGIVGETEPMYEVLERVVQIAPVDATVLVTGESGTGKELVARGMHALSRRRHKPFIAVNVAALAETLLESELFGHEKGAFTGAIDSRKGLFELANGGTIFLDEIGEMPLTTQTKLLRVLEQREFHRVGGEKSIQVDVRIIAATNQDLRRLVVLGDFRRDLYYRLNVLNIVLPPLRQRREDIPLLIDTFIHEASTRHDRPFVGIAGEAMDILCGYHWPGNVRELRNLVESMVVLAPGREIQPVDIPAEVRSPEAGSLLLPAPIPARGRSGGGEGEAKDIRPELEFIFRTLVDLRVDVDDLRKDFETYKRHVKGPEEPLRVLPAPSGEGQVEIGVVSSREATVIPPSEAGSLDEAVLVDHVDVVSEVSSTISGDVDRPNTAEKGAVVYREGMTMEDLEREAIILALQKVRGNRRKAAESLGIGERTLYRKIQKFGLEG